MQFSYTPSGPRPARTRDRRGRGVRGPAVIPAQPGTPETRTRRERFDALALSIISEVDARWSTRLGLIEYAVEDTPHMPEDWNLDQVPLSSLLRGSGGDPTRLVLFRRPIEHRCESRVDVEAMVLTIVVEQIAELLNVEPGVIDPRYNVD